MIINCGKRRIVSYTYGWKMEILIIHGEKSQTPGLQEWREDNPAWPSSLSHACQLLYDRELKDMGEVDISQLPEALKTAAETVRKYMEYASTPVSQPEIPQQDSQTVPETEK